jgi:hypothetical protein
MATGNGVAGRAVAQNKTVIPENAECIVQYQLGQSPAARRNGAAFQQGHPPGHVRRPQMDVHRQPVL